MFFEEDDILKSLCCPVCHRRFDEPKTLPCGETVCKRCIEDNFPDSDPSQEKNQFKCFVCQEIHAFPLNGLKTNKLLLSLLATQPKEVFRSKWIDEFKSNLRIIYERRLDLLQELDTRLEVLREYFDIKRTQINLMVESRLEEINKLKTELLEQVNNAEKEYLEAASQPENTASTLSEIESFTNQVEEFYKKWTVYLKQSFLNESEIKSANDSCQEINTDLSKAIFKAKKLIYNNKMFNFIQNEVSLDSSFLGCFKYEYLNKFSVDDFSTLHISLKFENFLNFSILDDNNFVFVWYLTKQDYNNYSSYYGTYNYQNVATFQVCDHNGKLLNSHQITEVTHQPFQQTTVKVYSNKIAFSYLAYHYNNSTGFNSTISKVQILNCNYGITNLGSVDASEYTSRKYTIDKENLYFLNETVRQIDVFGSSLTKFKTVKYSESIETVHDFFANDNYFLLVTTNRLFLLEKNNASVYKFLTLPNKNEMIELNCTYDSLIWRDIKKERIFENNFMLNESYEKDAKDLKNLKNLVANKKTRKIAFFDYISKVLSVQK